MFSDFMFILAPFGLIGLPLMETAEVLKPLIEFARVIMDVEH